MKDTLIISIAIAVVLASAAIATIDATLFAEANVLQDTLAEMQESPSPESHPYFWFCPEPGECAEDGYLTWYAAHGGL